MTMVGPAMVRRRLPKVAAGATGASEAVCDSVGGPGGSFSLGAPQFLQKRAPCVSCSPQLPQ
jgi:hypothetical protein